MEYDDNSDIVEWFIGAHCSAVIQWRGVKWSTVI